MLATTNERHHLRATIDAQLPTDQDLDAFLVDFFPDVYRRCSSGMDRTAKVSLLFTLAAADEIADKLRLRPEKGPRPAIGQKRRLWRLPLLIAIVGLVVGWIALHLNRQPHSTAVSSIPDASEREESPAVPHVATYKGIETPAERQKALMLKYIEGKKVKLNEIRLRSTIKSDLRVLSYHWMNRSKYPPILDVLIENGTKSGAIITSVYANIIEYYPLYAYGDGDDDDGEIQQEIATIDIALPTNAENHHLYLEDPIKINPGKTGRVKLRFLEPNEMASARQLEKPFYLFELGIKMADETVLVITNLSLFRPEHHHDIIRREMQRRLYK